MVIEIEDNNIDSVQNIIELIYIILVLKALVCRTASLLNIDRNSTKEAFFKPSLFE